MVSGAKVRNLYSVHPGVEQTQKWVKELPMTTGRSLEKWVAFIKGSGPAGEKERREWLKEEHKLGTNYASWLAGRAGGKNMEEDSPEAYLKTAAEWVEARYADFAEVVGVAFEER